MMSRPSSQHGLSSFRGFLVKFQGSMLRAGSLQGTVLFKSNLLENVGDTFKVDLFCFEEDLKCRYSL